MDIDYSRRIASKGIRSKTKSCNHRLPLSCVNWLKVQGELTGLSESETIQCLIAHAVTPHLDGTYPDCVEQLKLIKHKTGRARPVWLASSTSGLRTSDIANAYVLKIDQKKIIEAWENVEQLQA